MFFWYFITFIGCSITCMTNAYGTTSSAQELKSQLLEHLVKTQPGAFAHTLRCYCRLISAHEQQELKQELLAHITILRSYLTTRISERRSHRSSRIGAGFIGSIETLAGVVAAEIYINHREAFRIPSAPLKDFFSIDPNYRAKAWACWGTHTLAMIICATIVRLGIHDLCYAYTAGTYQLIGRLKALEDIAQLLDTQISSMPDHALAQPL